MPTSYKKDLSLWHHVVVAVTKPSGKVGVSVWHHVDETVTKAAGKKEKKTVIIENACVRKTLLTSQESSSS